MNSAGLDAAIEAATKAAQGRSYAALIMTGWPESDKQLAEHNRKVAEAAVRAAAPHIRRAVLNEAADRAIKWGSGKSIYGGGEVAEWLRERAGQEGPDGQPT